MQNPGLDETVPSRPLPKTVRAPVDDTQRVLSRRVFWVKRRFYWFRKQMKILQLEARGLRLITYEYRRLRIVQNSITEFALSHSLE